MKVKLNTYAKKFVRYILRTYKNKIVALGLLLCCAAAWSISGDGTALVAFAIPIVLLFLAKKNYIY